MHRTASQKLQVHLCVNRQVTRQKEQLFAIHNLVDNLEVLTIEKISRAGQVTESSEQFNYTQFCFVKKSGSIF